MLEKWSEEREGVSLKKISLLFSLSSHRRHQNTYDGTYVLFCFFRGGCDKSLKFDAVGYASWNVLAAKLFSMLALTIHSSIQQ